MVRFLTALLLICAFAFPATAQNDVRDMPEVVQVSLLPGWRSDDGRHFSALRIALAPGWKTYWRSPGDAGIPPQFDWRGSQNLEGVRILWPHPKIFVDNGIRTIGYKGEVILPIEFHPANTLANMTTKLSLTFGICKDICMPVTAKLRTKLRAKNTTPDQVIALAMTNGAKSRESANVRAVKCRLEPSEAGMNVEARIDMPSLAGQREIAVIEVPGQQLWVTEATATRSGGQLVAKAQIINNDGGAVVISRSQIQVTIIGDTETVALKGCTGG